MNGTLNKFIAIMGNQEAARIIAPPPILHKKGLYFDGHDQPDVVAYRQNHFLPMMKKYEPCIVRYNVGDVDTELIQPQNYVGC
jgi:hypothetical protein